MRWLQIRQVRGSQPPSVAWLPLATELRLQLVAGGVVEVVAVEVDGVDDDAVVDKSSHVGGLVGGRHVDSAERDALRCGRGFGFFVCGVSRVVVRLRTTLLVPYFYVSRSTGTGSKNFCVCHALVLCLFVVSHAFVTP